MEANDEVTCECGATAEHLSGELTGSNYHALYGISDSVTLHD